MQIGPMKAIPGGGSSPIFVRGCATWRSRTPNHTCQVAHTHIPRIGRTPPPPEAITAQSVKGEQPFVGAPKSFYNLTKSIPDPLSPMISDMPLQHWLL